MTSYGPTMIIDQCESAHQQQPLPLRATSSGGLSDTSDNTVGLSVDNDEEQQLLSHTPATPATGGGGGGNDPSSISSPSLLSSMNAASVRSTNSFNLMHNTSYGSLRYRTNPATSSLAEEHVAPESIRFQVVVWDVGPVDVALGRVPMTFRVTMFWDDEEEEMDEPVMDDHNNQGTSLTPRPRQTEWTMEGRRKAYERLITDDSIVKKVDVPPISLLNVVTFDVIGQAEVCVLRDNSYRNKALGGRTIHRRLMRWTCLYKATLMQHNMRLDTFPHDEHTLTLKIGLLVHRRGGGRWDMNKYRLDLATEDDSQHSTRIPHGLIVDHARVPDFQYNSDEGLDFQFVPCPVGGEQPCPVGGRQKRGRPDSCLEVRLRVGRDSGYYDQNIMPLIGMLNLVAVTIPLSMESVYFFQRGLLLLNITFVQIGIRMNVDKHLPSVGYQIKMQSIMNQFFFALLLLVLESSGVYVLNDRYKWTIDTTNQIDTVVALMSLAHILVTFATYYWNKVQLKRSLARGAPLRDDLNAKGKKPKFSSV